jgi:PhzF family phenazine biosynthesis protein
VGHPKVSAYASVVYQQIKSLRQESNMRRSVEIFQVDAFTDKPFTGNPAGVVLGADVLDSHEMQAIARELNNGDTLFVCAPNGADHDISVRFFTPHREANFVGHATLAAHAVLQTRAPQALRRQRGRSGVVQVEALPDGRLCIRQPPAPLERELLTAELDRVLDAVGLSRPQLDTQCPPRIVGGSSTRLLVGLQSSLDLSGLQPRMEVLTTLSAQLGAQGYFFYTRRTAARGCDVESRMFCPAIGIAEDPVSGNAHAMLGHYLFTLGLLDNHDGCARFSGAQGASLSRPGQVDVEVRSDAQQRVQSVGIAGRAVVVFAARLEL